MFVILDCFVSFGRAILRFLFGIKSNICVGILIILPLIIGF